MILHTEDCIDCLRGIFNTQYEFVFLYNHSSGHAKKRVGGLDAKNMNKGKMVTLAHFIAHQIPGWFQYATSRHCVYSSCDDIEYGPFYLPNEKRELTRHDRYVCLDKN
jgi:hypothetical protein